ncbi:MAG: calcium-binding protein [Clostridiales bacterium]
MDDFEYKLDEQDLRIQKILKGINEEDEFKVFERWNNYLIKNLDFPFEAEISEWQECGPLKEGSIIKILSIDDFYDLYGVVANVTYKRSKYNFPLCDVEVVDKKSKNFGLIYDYSVWFANR